MAASRLNRAALAAALSLLAASTALAAPVLKSVARVNTDIVTIGDLVEDAGPFAREALFQSPDLGTTGSVPVAQVIERARALGLSGIRTRGLTDIVVTRQARDITPDDLAARIRAEAALRLGTSEAAVELVFDQQPPILKAEQSANAPFHVLDLGLVPSTGRFEATIQVEKGGKPERLTLRGQVTEMVDVVTLNRGVQKGELVVASDIQTQRTPKRQAQRIGQVNPDDIVGKAAKRDMRPGLPLSPADFGQPVLVRKGDLVTLVVDMPGLTLTVRGLAQEPGAKGEQIGVMNEQSKRLVHGIVAGPGRVIVTGATRQVASLGRVQQ